MTQLRFILQRERHLKGLLLIVSSVIYLSYFHPILFNANSVLSSITSDALKNYYTYVYHIRHDTTALHFSGMAYPYGEHVVYTDCQPVLTFVLRALPFTHTYLIGILHVLIFLSFIISPVILYAVFRLTDTGKYTSFFVSLGLALLAPQFLKINAGHYGLAYACIIPCSLYLLLSYFKTPGSRNLLLLFTYHCFLFLLHPYHGFSVGIFACLSMVVASLPSRRFTSILKSTGAAVFVSAGPAALFRGFMLLTDKHPNRTSEPYGLNMMIENIDSLLAPVFGPMKGIMELAFNNRVNHYEGHTYLGLTSLLLVLIVVVALPLVWRKLAAVQPATVAFLFAALVLLFISFGWHYTLFEKMGFNTAFMNQFRATCRFAWFFYYALPLFLVPLLYSSFSLILLSKSKAFAYSLPLLYLLINFGEAHYMFKLDDHLFWKFRNFFNERLLNSEEKTVLASLRERPTQAILPLPVFHSGSEMYDRKGFNYSMIPSMLYSANSGIPIFSVLMSRTSISETENTINLLNSYLKVKPAALLMDTTRLFLMRTETDILPDEHRLWRCVKPIFTNDTLQGGFLDYATFSKPKLTDNLIKIPSDSVRLPGDDGLVYIPFYDRKPFVETAMNDTQVIFNLDSNVVKSGAYVVSCRYYYTDKNYHALASDMVVTETGTDSFVWKYMLPMRFMSGIYRGYGVMEATIDLEANKKYGFVMMGREEKTYRISHFMLRPANTTVFSVLRGDTCYNNFPD